MAVGCTSAAAGCVGGSVVGEASIVGCIVATIGAGVAVGDELQAAKIAPNPIVILNPKILKVFICCVCLIVSPLELTGSLPPIGGLVVAWSLSEK